MNHLTRHIHNFFLDYVAPQAEHHLITSEDIVDNICEFSHTKFSGATIKITSPVIIILTAGDEFSVNPAKVDVEKGQSYKACGR